MISLVLLQLESQSLLPPSDHRAHRSIWTEDMFIPPRSDLHPLLLLTSFLRILLPHPNHQLLRAICSYMDSVSAPRIGQLGKRF
jgi:hypothetical protein